MLVPVTEAEIAGLLTCIFSRFTPILPPRAQPGARPLPGAGTRLPGGGRALPLRHLLQVPGAEWWNGEVLKFTVMVKW